MQVKTNRIRIITAGHWDGFHYSFVSYKEIIIGEQKSQ